MIAIEQVAQSDYLTAFLALLNVVQTLWLADIAARSRRFRRVQAQTRRRPPPSIPEQEQGDGR